jgi:hypothetical protein
MIRLALLVAAVVALIVAATWFYNKGGESVQIEIERQNNAAGTSAEDARTAYDRCVDPPVSGVYDYATGKCRRASPRGRN